jgi:hypothetical protein
MDDHDTDATDDHETDAVIKLRARQLIQASRGSDHRLADLAADAGLALWLCASLIGIMLGVALAKFAQAWSDTAVHPAVVSGAVAVVASAVLGIAAVRRYLGSPSNRPPEARLLAYLSLLLVLALGWAGLAIIALAGWEIPSPSRAS